MASKLPIKAPALKEKNGKIDPAPSKAWSHSQLEAAKHLKKKKVKEGFVTSEGKFVSRKKAAQMAEDAGEVKDKRIKKLHSSDLRAALHIKKKVLK